MSLVSELRRRNVLRVAAAYVVVSWLIIQVAETVLPFYGVADSVIRWIITLLVIGLIPAVVVAWVFELTPEGLRRDSEVDHAAPSSRAATRNLDRGIILALVLALAFFAVDKWLIEPERDRALVEETKQVARSEAVVESYGDRSIAVLPFVDMSVNQDQQYMSDGIAEELLNLLAQIPQLRVISRSSSFAFRNDEVGITEVAQRLNVNYVLEGSVRKAGDQVRITAQLIEARSDTHLWSDSYDRKLENIFQIQDEIAQAVVDQLKLALLEGAPKSKVVDEAAYQHMLQARYFWNRRAEGDVERALEHFEAVLETSPEYAPAWAGVAWARSVLAIQGVNYDDEGLRLAEVAARKAVELDPDSSDAHVRLGQAQGRAGEFRASMASYEKALELDPDNPLALGVMALQLWKTGDFETCIRMFEELEAMDPLSAIWPANRTTVLIRAARYEEALAANERFFVLSGNQALYDANRAVIYELTGRYEESWELTKDMPDFPDPLAGKAMLLHHLGRQDEAEAARRKLEAMNPPNSWYHMAKIYARWGEIDKAFEQLSEKNVGDMQVWHLRYDPHLQALHDDPRWSRVLDQALDPFRADAGAE